MGHLVLEKEHRCFHVGHRSRLRKTSQDHSVNENRHTGELRCTIDKNKVCRSVTPYITFLIVRKKRLMRYLTHRSGDKSVSVVSVPFGNGTRIVVNTECDLSSVYWVRFYISIQTRLCPLGSSEILSGSGYEDMNLPLIILKTEYKYVDIFRVILNCWCYVSSCRNPVRMVVRGFGESSGFVLSYYHGSPPLVTDLFNGSHG